MNKLQCVSAFYDIGRDKWQTCSRSVEKYINDFFSFYSNVSVDLILFCEPKFAQYLKKRIEHYKINNIFLSNIKFIEFNFSNLYFFKNIDKIENVMIKPKMLEMYRMTRSPEYSKPEYVALMWSKMEIVFEAIKLNLISGDKVAWIDFGIAHSTRDYIDRVRGNVLIDKLISEKNIFFKRQEIEFSESPEYYLSLSDNVITAGGYFILNKSDVNIIFEHFKDICEDLLKFDISDDDQTVLSILAKKHPDLIYNQSSTMFRANPSEGDWFPVFFNLEKI